MYRCLLSDFFEKDMKIVMDAYMFVNKRKRERCSARMSEHPFFYDICLLFVSAFVSESGQHSMPLWFLSTSL